MHSHLELVCLVLDFLNIQIVTCYKKRYAHIYNGHKKWLTCGYQTPQRPGTGHSCHHQPAVAFLGYSTWPRSTTHRTRL